MDQVRVLYLVAIGLERARAQDLAAEIEAAKQSEQLRTTLIDAMAHEFKTPLTLIMGPADLLLNESSGLNEKSRKHSLLIKKNASRLLRLINQLMDFRKIEERKMAIYSGQYASSLNLREICSQ